MKLAGEYLPATTGARQELVLLHGWGCNREIWRSLLVALRPWANITLLDLPGCAPGCEAVGGADLESTLDAVLASSPAQAVYVGWSLGGQLAVELATRYPARVAALVTICSTPRFVAGPDWPGMKSSLFAQFRAAVERDSEAALRRFDSLQVAGSEHPRVLQRQLQGLRRGDLSGHLLAGLDWLGELDQRALLPNLQQPQLHMLGDRDGLLSDAVARTLTHLLADTPDSAVVSLPRASHVAPLDSCEAVATGIWQFLRGAGLLCDAPGADALLAKQDVAESFSRAASHYDSVARLQRDVGTRLLTSLDQLPARPTAVLDLGCGTGYFYPELRRRFPQADYIGLDLAQGMVEYARDRWPEAGTWLVADAEALPLVSGSVDLVFSSLAIQWCFRLDHLFAELARVLRPGGRCVFTSLGPGTLCELRAAWAAVDANQHVNSFLPASALETAVQGLSGLELELEAELFRMEYPRVRDLLAELKALGAHNMNRGRPVGLTGRRTLQGMLQAYETRRDRGVLPATYDVLFGVLEKS